MQTRVSSLPQRLALSSGLAVLALVISGCAVLDGFGPTQQEAPESTTTAAPEAPVEPPVYNPDGSAQDNLAAFTAIMNQVSGSATAVEGRAYIDALVAAGFDKSAMQVTQDFTTVGNPVESLQFSVRIGAECLIGQVGPSTGAPVAAVAAVLAQDRCLVGTTRAIDW